MHLHLSERRTHDYVRHRTTSLFAALEIATGQVTAAVATTPTLGVPGTPFVLDHPDQDLHQVMVNYAAHKRVEIRDWQATNPPGRVHFTHHLENVSELGRGLVRHHGTASHPPRHVPLGPRPQRQDLRVHRWPERPRTPFAWTKTAEEILKKGQPSEHFKPRPTSELDTNGCQK